MTGAPGRTLVVTYCCRDKDPAPGLLPAVERYLSPRIRQTALAAGAGGFDFRILSGQFGLIPPDHSLPDYDHLLTAAEVPEISIGVAEGLTKMSAAKVVFVTRPLAEDPGTGPYREVMARACRVAGVDFFVREIGPGRPGPELLDGLS